MVKADKKKIFCRLSEEEKFFLVVTLEKSLTAYGGGELRVAQAFEGAVWVFSDCYNIQRRRHL